MAENTIILDADVKPLKKQLREATLELQTARQKFGEFSTEAVQAAQKVAGIRDGIDSANEAAQLFDPGKRFQALTNAASVAAGAIGAAQGAMALFGGESEDVQKALLKVQSAMALSQGLSQLKDISKVTEGLKISFKGLTAGANGLKKALISTGIGALVVAVGLLVVYWEDIMGLVGGVGSEQKKLNASAEENLKTQEEKLEAIDGQSNQLKLQGKSEKEILEMKVAQTDEAIKAAEMNILNAKNTKKAQVDASQRNKDIAQGMIAFLSLPITMLLKAVDALTFGLAKTGVIEEATNFYEQYSGGLAELLFDPKEVAEKGDATIKEAEGKLNQLKEKQAGFQLSMQGIDKAAAEKGAAEKEKQDAKTLEAEKILSDARIKMLDKQKQEELAVEAAYAEKFLKLKQAGIEDDGTLAKAKAEELATITKKYQDQELAEEAAFQKTINGLRTQMRLEGIEDENTKAREVLLLEQEKRRTELLAGVKDNAERKKILELELAATEKQEMDTLNQSFAEADAIRELEELDKEIARADMSLQIEKDLLDQKEALLKQQLATGVIDITKYNAETEALTKARIELDKKEGEAKMAIVSAVQQSLSIAADVIGKDTKAGKALGVASATINTFQGISAGVKLGFPAAIPAVAAAAATGFAAVKNILAVKVPGGGGVSAPSLSIPAPSTASAVPTIGTSPVTALGSIMANQPPLKAYVVESEVTGTQKRVADIERRAGF